MPDHIPSKERTRRPKKLHHCPICAKPCTVRCETKGHVVRCEVHQARLYRPGDACVSCHQSELRTIREERERRMDLKPGEKEEGERSRKKKKKKW